jgi:hypothetical protein
MAPDTPAGQVARVAIAELNADTGWRPGWKAYQAHRDERAKP